MVSTNQSLVKLDDTLISDTRRQRRHQQKDRNKAHSRKNRRSVQTQTARTFPKYEDLRGVLLFFSLPVMIILLSSIFSTPIPKPLLYGIASLLGFYIVMRSYYSVELVLAVALLYFPFSKTYIIPIAPGLNGTNVFLVLVLMAAFFQAQRTRSSLIEIMSGSKIVFFFTLLSAYSAVTLTFMPGGFEYFKNDIWYVYKAWLDQFILYFVAHSVIRDRELAKRVIIYIVVGSLAVVFYSIPEMLEKMGNSDIDKMRVGGPHQQPNNFGGFIAYTILPVIALFIVYIKNIKAWLVAPYLLLSVKLLITSFSRGAYLAMALSGLLTGYLRGKAFVFYWLSIGLVLVLMFPSVIPQAVVDRLGNTEKNVSSSTQQLDKSSQTRLVMWEAAIEMTAENPFFGKGFKAFPLLKEQYTDSFVRESDPHNMYFYISSQMGIPALVLFLLIFLNMFEMGRKLARKSDDKFIRAAGIGGAGMAASMAIINVFGSRFINIDFTCYFLVYYVVLQVFFKELLESEKQEKLKRKKQRNFPKAVISREQG